MSRDLVNAICAGFPGAEVSDPWGGGHDAWKVGGKMFACVGAVIRGETDHYDYVCAEAARGIQEVQLRTGVPCGFGVLTVDTYEQALARSGEGKRDSGAHAAEAVLALARIRTALVG